MPGGREVMTTLPGILGKGGSPAWAMKGGRTRRLIAPRRRNALLCPHHKDQVYDRFGEVGVLMNNAGTSPGGGPWDHYERWQRVLNVNLWGVINGVQSFTQVMIATVPVDWTASGEEEAKDR